MPLQTSWREGALYPFLSFTLYISKVVSALSSPTLTGMCQGDDASILKETSAAYRKLN